jgi:hypothetical protein
MCSSEKSVASSKFPDGTVDELSELKLLQILAHQVSFNYPLIVKVEEKLKSSSWLARACSNDSKRPLYQILHLLLLMLNFVSAKSYLKQLWEFSASSESVEDLTEN